MWAGRGGRGRPYPPLPSVAAHAMAMEYLLACLRIVAKARVNAEQVRRVAPWLCSLLAKAKSQKSRPQKAFVNCSSDKDDDAQWLQVNGKGKKFDYAVKSILY